MPSATDTSFKPPVPRRAERPGVDVREHPGRLSGSGSAGCLVHLRDFRRVILQAQLREQAAQRHGY
jgi:hypothetical protein